MWAGRYGSSVGAAPGGGGGPGGSGGTDDAGIRWRERWALRQFFAHHTARNSPAPTDSTRPTPEIAVERTSKVEVSSTIDWSGLVTSTSIVNAPDVRTRTGTSSVVVPGGRFGVSTDPSGNSSWSLSSSTRTSRFWSEALVSRMGIVLLRDVRVIRNCSGSVTAPCTDPSAALTRST